MSQALSTRLAVGTAAPTFETEDLFGNSVNLSADAGRWVLLSFYRMSACALCNLRVHELISKYADYQARGLDIIAVFESPREMMLQFVGRQDAPFPLISDPQAALYDLYGVETSVEKVQATMQAASTPERIAAAKAAGFELTPEPDSNFNRMPADFLIDPDGIIREAFYSELVGEHLPQEVIEGYLPESVR